MAWPPRFEEDLHPRGRGGKFASKPGVPDVPHDRSTPPKPGAPVKPAAPGKAAKKVAAKKSPQRRRRAMRYDAQTATPRLQATGQPDVPLAARAPRVDGSGPLGTGAVLNTGSRATAHPTLPGESIVPIGGLGPKATQLAIGRRPDGTMDWNVRGTYVDQKLIDMRNNGIDTEAMFRDPVTKDWSPERLAQQEAVMDEMWDAHAAHVPNEGRAIFSGGLGGAGKGYVLGKVEQVPDRDFFTINPDDVKALMAKRGMIPLELDPNMTPMELSPVVHEEASDMAMRLAERAYAERKNVVWDITMSSENSVVKKRLALMREAGYTDVGALFVDTTVERSIAQASGRWVRGMQEYIDGDGEGGRYLPSKATAENLPTPGSGYNSKNREVFEAIKHNFDGYVVYENIDRTRLLETQGKGLPK